MPEQSRRVDSSGGAANPLLATIVGLIDAASVRGWLRVAWWGQRVPEARRVLDACVAARGRGADVQVLCRPAPENTGVITALKGAAATVHLRSHEHGKELLADNAHLLFSMNLTGKEIRRNLQNG